MIYEVAAAVEYIAALVQGVERDRPIAPEAIAGFSSTLKDELETRCQSCWMTSDPEHGSALRAVAWQLYPGGEGADAAILRAIASVLQAQTEEGEVVQPSSNQTVALALRWLPNPFTLWIDPGCVAVRNGGGPGSVRSFFDDGLDRSAASSGSINVIWGQMIAQPAAEKGIPQLTISGTSALRPIPIMRPQSTTNYQHNHPQHLRYPVQSMGNGRPSAHRRNISNASSSAASFSEGLTRSVSLSSTQTTSTHATSEYSHGMAGADEDSDACPSLVSPSSSCTSSRCTAENESDGDLSHDVTARFIGARLFDDEDDEEADAADETAGDITIHADQVLGLQRGAVISGDASSTPKRAKNAPQPNDSKNSAPAAKTSVSAPVKSNYTTHDNGNVGVLGGGVRLGGAVSKPQGQTGQRVRQHSNSKSIGHLQGLHGQIYPQHQLRRPDMHQQPFYGMNPGNYSAPMRNVPLPSVAGPAPMPAHAQVYGMTAMPGVASQQQRGGAPHYMMPNKQQFLPQPLSFQMHHQQQQHHALQQPALGLMRNGPAPTVSFQLPPPSSLANVAMAGSVVGEDDGACSDRMQDGRRRVRSRGRRSRGRGAGRAARRAAAALRALESGDLDLDLIDEDLDATETNSSISRCSTPATASEYTSSYASSCFSSTQSTPAKDAGKKLIQALGRGEDDSFDLDFALELRNGLAVHQNSLLMAA
ncbi:hypothetical protein BCV70DRAFT_62607 [Testicularia cyperi]|uniref:Anti-proliferative protein domain-containing protein n=1 Tax=Testicularia cyperi TaxID=1882483 RepID=A0A317XVL8_9BASI|nr:hypothetical protein BCV70DRAFT_62607 [Testicularia cyperi]